MPQICPKTNCTEPFSHGHGGDEHFLPRVAAKPLRPSIPDSFLRRPVGLTSVNPTPEILVAEPTDLGTEVWAFHIRAGVQREKSRWTLVGRGRWMWHGDGSVWTWEALVEPEPRYPDTLPPHGLYRPEEQAIDFDSRESEIEPPPDGTFDAALYAAFVAGAKAEIEVAHDAPAAFSRWRARWHGEWVTER